METLEEMKSKVKSLYCFTRYVKDEEILRALLMNDTKKLEGIKSVIEKCDLKIQAIYNDLDNANDDESRMQVLGALSRGLE